MAVAALPLRVPLRSEVRFYFGGLIDAVARGKWLEALEILSAFEAKASSLIVLNNGSRGVEQFRDICRRLRLYINEARPIEDRHRFILEQIEKLRNLFLPAEVRGDPYEALRSVYNVIKEDWYEFFSRPSRPLLELLVDDLAELERLEPLMRGEPDDQYKQFRTILEARGRCMANMPILVSIADGVQTGLRPETKQAVIEAFSRLFSEIEKLLAPYRFVYTAPAEERPAPSFIRVEEEEEGEA
jgi:hypothetical protein